MVVVVIIITVVVGVVVMMMMMMVVVVVIVPPSGRRRRARLFRGEILSDIGDTALKGNLAEGRVAGDEIGLGSDNMQDHIAGQVTAQLGEPHAHVDKGLGIGDGVAEDAGAGAAVVEAGYGAEAFLAGCGGLLVIVRVVRKTGGRDGRGIRQNDVPVSQIWSRTIVSESASATRLVRKLAPTVLVVWLGSKLPLQ